MKNVKVVNAATVHMIMVMQYAAYLEVACATIVMVKE
jgi:hypothetical protein